MCTLVVRKKEITLKYNTKVSKNILSTSKFIRDVSKLGKWGVGDYSSVIRNMDDMEQAIPHLKKVYEYKIKN